MNPSSAPADKRDQVRAYYGNAAEKPSKDLCCPTSYPKDHVGHIPQDVIDRFYGCGSPVAVAGLRAGETHADLGSGAGIDCFIASKLVGATGRSIGVDMTDQMLKVAEECRPVVAENLGWSNVEFRKGFLEKLPIDLASVDCVTSNCVINLSPDKHAVFGEIRRVLRDHGRLVVSDIVSATPVPAALRADPKRWGECLAGAMTRDEFLAGLEKAGFYGTEILGSVFWKVLEGIEFHSVTVRAFRYEKKAGCVFIGQSAVYNGPGKSFGDDEGHTFQRGVSVEVCTDTAAKLRAAPYAQNFTVTDPAKEKLPAGECCGSESKCC
jgi:SAM-dependent methyltransferase